MSFEDSESQSEEDMCINIRYMLNDVESNECHFQTFDDHKYNTDSSRLIKTVFKLPDTTTLKTIPDKYLPKSDKDTKQSSVEASQASQAASVETQYRKTGPFKNVPTASIRCAYMLAFKIQCNKTLKDDNPDALGEEPDEEGVDTFYCLEHVSPSHSDFDPINSFWSGR